jgi:hypothetical protein
MQLQTALCYRHTWRHDVYNVIFKIEQGQSPTQLKILGTHLVSCILINDLNKTVSSAAATKGSVISYNSRKITEHVH